MTTVRTSDDVLAEIIVPLIEEVEEESGEEIVKARDTPLLGDGSVIDSLTLVTLLISAEERLEEETGRAVTLVDERAMSKRASPFRTLGTLADHICTLL